MAEATNAELEAATASTDASEVPETSGTSTSEENISPRDVASKISKWLHSKGVSQTFFAKTVLNRSQGSFSDYLTKAPNELPTTHGRAIWFTLSDFLNDPKRQVAVISEYKKGKKSYFFVLLRKCTIFLNSVL